MNRFLVDASFVLLLLVIGYGVMKSESETSQNIGSQISEFDSNLQDGHVIDDGYVDGKPIESQDKGLLGNAVDAFNNVVIKVVDGGFDIFIKAIKGALS